MTDHPTLGDIVRAQQRLRHHLRPTPLEAAADLGAGTFLKLENANLTHSFKIRGALNAMLSLDEQALARGIVAASSGNFAMAVAYAARVCGASAQILMPVATPKKKVDGVSRYGAGAAEAVLFGDNFDQAEAEALRRAEGGLTWLSPYNDRRVIAGAGTIGVEIVSELPRVERVLVPVGGGGLIAGVATALKELDPAVEVIGVSSESTPAMFNVFHGSDRPHVWNTLAEALSGDIEPGSMTVPICKRYLDDVVLVAEEEIASAMRFLVDVQGWVVEGGGAVGVAALLQGAIPRDGKVAAVVVSGGNVDGETLRRVLQLPEPG